ncbi:MAG: Zn-ribbon domain-containing OB-fold protein [bacterium]|nr:Zn-ribbon domain-containing OB-fold protein [bacterium]
MRVVRDLEWQGPVPAGEGEYGEFFAAAAEGRLLIQQCPQCGHRQHYPRALCTACAAEPEWLEAAGTGTVHTYTIVRQYGVPAFAELPYVLAMVDLPEGVRMFGGLTGIDPEAVEIGMAVTAYARTYDDDHAMVFWEPSQ